MLAAAWAAPAPAHPADEAVVYHYISLRLEPKKVSLQHATIVGGLIAHRVWPALDVDGDRTLSPQEQERHARTVFKGLSLRIDGRRRAWNLDDFQYPSHQEFFGRNFPTIDLRLSAKNVLLKPGTVITVRDDTWPDETSVFPQPEVRAGPLATGPALISVDGRTIDLRIGAAPGVSLGAESRFSGTRSGPRLPGLELSPDLSRPGSPAARLPARSLDELDIRKAPLFPERGKVLFASPGEQGHNETKGLRGFLGRPLSPALVLLGLGAALIAGAAHALTPGHGKSMVAAYLVGSRGTVGDAVILGIVVTITHTSSVFLLGLASLWLTSWIRAEVVAQWLAVVSGALVLGMGFWLFQRGILAYHGIRPPAGHAHDHAHGHAHSHGHAQAHTHEHDPAPVARIPPHDSPLDGRTAQSTPAEAVPPVYSRWGVIGLGVAGGMVPCTDALAILLAAVNLGSVAIGMVLIAAFSVGMAAVLVALGVLMVTAKGFVDRISTDNGWVRALPAVSGAILVCLGAWLTFLAMSDIGILRTG